MGVDTRRNGWTDGVLSTLGNYCSGSYIANYNQFGKVYQLPEWALARWPCSSLCLPSTLCSRECTSDSRERK